MLAHSTPSCDTQLGPVPVYHVTCPVSVMTDLHDAGPRETLQHQEQFDMNCNLVLRL